MKNLIFLIISFLLGGLCNHYFFGKKNYSDINKRIVKDSLDVLTDKEPIEELIVSYYAPEYTQDSNGKKILYQDFLKKIKKIKNDAQSFDLTWEHLIAEKDKVCGVYTMNMTKKNGEKVGYKILALNQIKDGKIIFTDEFILSDDALK